MITSTQLKIERVDCYWGSVPVECSFSYGEVERFSFVLVRLSAGATEGWGESLHRFDELFTELLRRLPGTSIAHAIAGNAHHSRHVEYLNEAVDIAAYDLLGQVTRRPMCELLGTPKRRAIPLMPTIFCVDHLQAAEQARRFADRHMRFLKIKLTGNLDTDLRNLHAIRQAAPQIKHLVGDANEGYHADGLRRDRALSQLKSTGLSIIEDPCAASFAELATLRSADHPRIMLDMSVRTRPALRAALDAGAADMINLHPCQQGSFCEATARAMLCETYGTTAWIGGTGFLGIGSAAYQHLAGVIGLSGPCGELAGSQDHGMPSLVQSSVQIGNGFAHLSNEPGHGATPLIDDALGPYLEGSIHFE